MKKMQQIIDRQKKNMPVWGVLLFSMFLFVQCKSQSGSPDRIPFSFVEGTVKKLHTSLKTRGITCEQVVQGYIDRIKAYDNDSTQTALKSVIMVNPKALEEARDKDQNFGTHGIEGPLYCVPILVKDNFNTQEMPTTGGALAFSKNRPTHDAYTIRKLREAGAIILGKANLDEFAFGFKGKSSIRGLVKNAYDTTKGAGGSSSGTGTAIAASLAMTGTGTDTGGSIRVPSSLAGLVGIRPSMRLVSQAGILPLSHWQDTAGPMCRTVQDCALMLDAMTGFDSSYQSNQRVSYKMHARLINNRNEYKKVTGVPDSYTDFLDANGLQGAHIGVVRALFGTDSVAVNIVNPVINAAIAKMRAAGATVEDVTIDNLHAILHDYSSMSNYEFKYDLEKYLDAWSNIKDHHILNYKDLVASEGYLSGNKRTIKYRGAINIDSLTNKQRKTYNKNTIERPVFVRKRLMRTLDHTDASGDSLGRPYDILLYPAITGIAAKLGDSPETGSNNRLSPFSLFPALVMPADMATNLDPAMPVGMEMLGREFDEPMLIKIAYAYQELGHPRKAPTNTPTLHAAAKTDSL